jgi:hypothetical protein
MHGDLDGAQTEPCFLLQLLNLKPMPGRIFQGNNPLFDQLVRLLDQVLHLPRGRLTGISVWYFIPFNTISLNFSSLLSPPSQPFPSSEQETQGFRISRKNILMSGARASYLLLMTGENLEAIVKNLSQPPGGGI